MTAKPRSANLFPGPGFRIRAEFDRLQSAIVQEFSQFEIPDISDQLNRLYSLDPEITCLTRDRHSLCGLACTVRVFPGDNLMVHKSLDIAKPGDIVIVAAGGSQSNAVLGDLICAKAKHRGIAGFIVDGLIRDLPGILELDIPVFARGVTPVGPLHRGPGEINFPVACGGVVINPGDIILADLTGIVAIPQSIAPELLERLIRYKAANAEYLASVESGYFSNQWVDEILLEQNCAMVTAEERQQNNGLGKEPAFDSSPESAAEMAQPFRLI